ncbi:hypothetical protein COCVIDRAFT_20685 [Bipolaris victoriae FI3]|uniref:Uncharacterized protein n=1 Tax=Bipolaris victoriae (strain FI3) TaxID=930091 RepID=W7DZ53_BIPV3|nr:hypothetical protein COCVIDRAFT_20685 [Bipolaris victoriae FI3]
MSFTEKGNIMAIIREMRNPLCPPQIDINPVLGNMREIRSANQVLFDFPIPSRRDTHMHKDAREKTKKPNRPNPASHHPIAESQGYRLTHSKKKDNKKQSTREKTLTGPRTQ